VDEVTKKKQYEETVQKVITLREESIKNRARARSRAREVMTYIQHDPYKPEEKDAADSKSKPLLRYNILISKLQTIIGNEQSSRRAVKIIADYNTNEQTVNILADNYDYIREREEYEQKSLYALADGLLYDTGGWMRGEVQIDDMGYNTMSYYNLSTLSVHPDPYFKLMDLSDCRYIVVDEWLTIDEIKNKFGVSDLKGEEEKEWWKDAESLLESTLQDGESEYKRGKRYLVCQIEERIETPVDLVEIDGEVLKLTKEEVREQKSKGVTMNYLRSTSTKRVKVTAVVPHFEHLVLQEKLNPLPTEHYSIFYCTSFDWFMEKSLQPSWGYLLVDVQDRINKGKSQEVDYMIQKLGSSWHIHENEKKAIEALQNGAGDPNLIVPYQSMKNIAKRETGAGDAASVQTVQNGVFADLQFVEEISNITQALQGRGGKSSESGVLFEMKRDQSLISSNPFYEIKNQMSRRILRHFLAAVPHIYFEDDRLVPLLHNGSLRYEMVNLNYGEEVLRDVRTVTLRSVLDSVENTPNRMERAFNEAIMLADVLNKLGYPAERIPFEAIIRNSNLRDKEVWLQMAAQGQRDMLERRIHDEAMSDMAQITGVART